MSSAVVPASASGGGYLATQSAARGLGPSTSTSIIAGDRRKIHTSFTEKGAEMVEEYDVHTDVLLLRKLRHKSSLGAWGPWVFEIGEPVAKFNADKDLFMESSNNPLFVRLDTPTHFQFRIRNLPYPYDNYLVTIESESQEIVLRTVNKKYYKRMNIPDLKAAGPEAGRLQEKFLSYSHAHNTLIISYVKPPAIVELEKKNLKEIKKMGNGATSSNALPAGSTVPKATTAAQALLAEAQGNAKAEEEGRGREFAGLNGLKGLANSKDADCKQQ